jgi:hypothetical protein
MLRKIFYSFLVLFTATQLHAQKVLGKISLQQGDTIDISMQLRNSITQQAGGQAIDFTIDGTAAHYYVVTNATVDNNTLHHQLKQLTFKFDGMGQKMSFNSDNPKDMKGQMGKPVREMLDKNYDMIIDPSGKVLLVKPEKMESAVVDERMMVIANMLKDLTTVVYPPEKNTSSFFKILPDREVGVGDTWEETTNSATEKSSTLYTLTAIGESTITVDFKTRSETSMKSQMMGIDASTAMTSVITGTILLDKTTGVIREKKSTAESNGKVDAMGMSMPVTAKTSMEIQVNPRSK